MRHALLIALSTVAGLGACAPVASNPYGYSYSYGYSTPAPAYGYYDGGYAPGPYYAEPGYVAPYVAPGPTIIVGGERRWRDGDRYRYDRPRYDGGFRGNGPGRDGGRPPPPQNFGGGARPGPAPVGMSRPGPAPVAAPPPVQQGPAGHSPSFNPANPTAQGERG